MGQMRYEAPESIEPAVALLAAESGEAWVLAGGTDLLVQLRADLIEPDLVVDVKKIPEMRSIVAEAGGFRIPSRSCSSTSTTSKISTTVSDTRSGTSSSDGSSS